MKRLSVRKKLTLWMTALMLALVIVVLGLSLIHISEPTRP